MTTVIKRDCTEQPFDKIKIYNAIMKAMKSSGIVKAKIAENITNEIEEYYKDSLDVDISDIEAMVYDKLITKGQRLTAKSYEGYRRVREFQREYGNNSTDQEIYDLIGGKSDYWKNENSNKNARLNTTQRDYMAGIVSVDAVKRYILPPDIVQADEDGIIHVHDKDYLLQFMTNCCLINLEDMLQNGTVISETLIEKPHSFSTACTITTQIIAQVASSQYGGQSISLAHLAPFVDVSRKKIRQEVINEHKETGIKIDTESVEHIVKKRLENEIKKGIQTIQYQITTLMTTNG